MHNFVAPQANPSTAKWTEREVQHALAFDMFSTCLCIPNCIWTGYECDLLVVTPKLKLIEVEVKLTKDDLRNDAKKAKWHKGYTSCEYPLKIWKHFYAFPVDVWNVEWLTHVRPASGVLIVNRWGKNGFTKSVRRAKADPTGAYTCTAPDVVSLSRLASLRMWTALRRMEEQITFVKYESVVGLPAYTQDEIRTKLLQIAFGTPRAQLNQ